MEKLIIGNWKMYKVYNEIQSFMKEFNTLIRKDRLLKKVPVKYSIAPTYIGLLPAVSLARGNLKIVAQDTFYEKQGSFTGSVSYYQLAEYDIMGSLVGHSEIRSMHHESNETINKKVLALLKNKMTAVLCIGESLKEYEENRTKNVITNQLKAALENVSLIDTEYLVIAYEPIWAIGTGKNASNEIIKKVMDEIHQILLTFFNLETVEKIRLLYGGSVNEENAKEILKIERVDGVLVGKASLEPQKFYKIITSTPEYLQLSNSQQKK